MKLDQQIAKFLATLRPEGTGPDARLEIMHALAAVLGMYLAGDLAKLGRRAYRDQGQSLLDTMAGVAETSAVQLRPKCRPELVGFSRPPPGAFTSPPADMSDPDGEKHVLLSALGATIKVGEEGWWSLPGWPRANVGITEEGLLLVVEGDEDTDGLETRWVLRRLETEDRRPGRIRKN